MADLAVPILDKEEYQEALGPSKRTRIIQGVSIILGVVAVVALAYVLYAQVDYKSSNGSGSASSKFAIVPGSKPFTSRFEFVDSYGRVLLESRDQPTPNAEISGVLTQISFAIRSAIRDGGIKMVGTTGSFGFVVRNDAGQIVAFSVQNYTSQDDMMVDIEILRQNAQLAVVEIGALSFSERQQVRKGVHSARVEITQEDRLFGYIIRATKLIVVDPIFTSKADCLIDIAQRLAIENISFVGDFEDITFPSIVPVPIREAWDRPNNPINFHLDGVEPFVYHYDTIKEKGWSSGRSNVMAWPETYWPTFEDGLSHRWQSRVSRYIDRQCTDDLDCLSPMEKYDYAFNKWRPESSFFSKKPYSPDNCGSRPREVSKHWDSELYSSRGPAAKSNPGNEICRNGVDDSANRLVDECTLNGCEYYPSPYDQQAKLARWFGLCHQWVPASILQPEPQHAVTIKTEDGQSINFQISDIKGLSLTLSYDSIFFGTRCNMNDEEIPRDRFGRIDNQVCRNTNAGAFHTVLVNLLAREGRPFAMDRTWDAPVWNQPVIGFEVKSEKIITNADEACKWLGGCEDGQGYNWNTKTKKWVALTTDVFWIAESYPSRDPRLQMASYFTQTSTYNYMLELDGDGNIIGGEWKFGDPEHPDFLFLPYDRPTSMDDQFKFLNYDKIMYLIEESMKPLDGSAKKEYSFKGKGFQHSTTLSESTLNVDVKDKFAVYQTHVKVNVANCSKNSKVAVKLSHGSTGIQFTSKLNDCKLPTLTTYGFTNMLSIGVWKLELETSEGQNMEIKDWELTFTDKPMSQN